MLNGYELITETTKHFTYTPIFGILSREDL